MSKVLVTGGAGFIGSHLVDRLIKEGHRVVVVDNLSTGKKENLNPRAKFYKADICGSKISQIFKKEKPQIVFHYAAQIDVRKSMENPAEDAKVNILGTLNVIQNFISINQQNQHESASKKFIFASSVGVYGEPKELPVTENHSLNPLAPYPITKLAIEKYLNYYQEQGLDFVILRYANIYGPRQSSLGEGGVVAIFIRQLLNQKKPVIFGDGNQTRDFLYIQDAISAAIKSIKAFSGAVYNIGTDREITINNLLKLLSQKLNKKVKPIFRPLRQGEIVKSRVDFSKAKRELKWSPKYNLDKGLEKTVNWFKDEAKKKIKK